MNLINKFNSTFNQFKKRIENGFSFIPASIRYDKNVNDTNKLLYTILVMLNNTYEYVYVSNEYLSELLKIPKSTIRDNLYKLKKLKYIQTFDYESNRYIKVRYDDLPKIKTKINIDASSLDHNSLSNYYALISGHVLLSDNLNSTEKILYAEIMALTNRFGFAFVTNKKLSEIMDLSERQLIRSLNNLLKYDFIRYGKDIKSKRLIYVTHHFKKEFTAIKNKNIRYKIIENESNSYTTIKTILNNTQIDDEIDNALDQIYKSMK